MDDGEVDFSNQEIFSSPKMDNQVPSSCSMDSFFDEILKDNHACTHAHTCNPPGPDSSHTHTCFHVHTKILPAPPTEDDTEESLEKNLMKRRPSGNREAVRKYREKKKARVASLEDEVGRLRALNQQLLKRLQGQAVLEAEIARLKCLLVDIKGRIEGEIGSFPYQKLTNPNLASAYAMNPCNVSCDDEVYCLHPGMEVGKGGEGGGGLLHEQGISGCEFGNVQCAGTSNLGLKELPGCGNGNMVLGLSSSNANKRKGGAHTATGV